MKGKVTIDRDRCKGCGLCVSVCPRHTLALDPNITNAKGYHPSSAVHPESCIACGNCARICPDSVITVERLKEDS